MYQDFYVVTSSVCPCYEQRHIGTVLLLTLCRETQLLSAGLGKTACLPFVLHNDTDLASDTPVTGATVFPYFWRCQFCSVSTPYSCVFGCNIETPLVRNKNLILLVRCVVLC